VSTVRPEKFVSKALKDKGGKVRFVPACIPKDFAALDGRSRGTPRDLYALALMEAEYVQRKTEKFLSNKRSIIAITGIV